MLRLPAPPPAADYPLDVPLPELSPILPLRSDSSYSASPLPDHPFAAPPTPPPLQPIPLPPPPALPSPHFSSDGPFQIPLINPDASGPYVKQEPSDDDDDWYGHGYGYGYDDEDEYANMFSMAGQPYTMNGSGFIKNLWVKLKRRQSHYSAQLSHSLTKYFN